MPAHKICCSTITELEHSAISDDEIVNSNRNRWIILKMAGIMMEDSLSNIIDLVVDESQEEKSRIDYLIIQDVIKTTKKLAINTVVRFKRKTITPTQMEEETDLVD